MISNTERRGDGVHHSFATKLAVGKEYEEGDAGNTFVWGGDTVIGERGQAAIVENNNIALHMLEDLHFQG